MRQITCSNCNESFQAPDNLAQAHCVRCGQAVALETNITADVAHPESYLERPPEDAVRAPLALPERYASWEEMRDLSPAIQRELTTLATRPMPDLRRVPVEPVPEDAPDEINDWGRPLGTIEVPGEGAAATRGVPWFVGVVAMVFFVSGVVGLATTELLHRPGESITAIVLGLAGVILAIWMAVFRKPTYQSTLWIFEAGVLLHRLGRLRACRWDDIQNYEASNETGRPLFWLTIEHDLTVVISHGHAPQVIPLMEYMEIRLSASQFLRRLKSICNGQRQRFGALALGREGIQGRGFFAPWAEVRRVISDAQRLFIDWSRQPEWVPVRYSDVSFPYLVMAIAHVMIDEHQRLPKD